MAEFQHSSAFIMCTNPTFHFPYNSCLDLRRIGKIYFEHFTGLPRAASTTQTCTHINACSYTRTKLHCCGASKLIVKFSHGGTPYHLSYPLYWSPSETSSIHSPSITRLLFTLFLQEHEHGSPSKHAKPIYPCCNSSSQTTYLIN